MALRLRPLQVLVQKLERALAVDLVEAVEEFDDGAVAEAERVVHPADFGVFVGDPFVGSDTVPVRPFDNERRGASFTSKSQIVFVD